MRQINALRMRQMKNFMATLLLSQGVPMICGGDEVARTQGGNNNAYCQDNEISWHDWNIRRAEIRTAGVYEEVDSGAARTSEFSEA